MVEVVAALAGVPGGAQSVVDVRLGVKHPAVVVGRRGVVAALVLDARAALGIGQTSVLAGDQASGVQLVSHGLSSQHNYGHWQGIWEPMPVAATFAFARDDGATLGDLARLDTMVTVVDAANFLPELERGDELAERGLAPFEDDERTVSDLLVDQIEFADVLVLNKLDLVDAAAAARLRAALARLNPLARIVEAEHARVGLRQVLGTGLFDLERAQQAPGWVRELNGEHIPETEEYGVSSTVFRSELPFHPGRLWDFVTEELDSGAYGRVLRSKGFFTLASRPHVTGLWSQAGSVARFEPSAARDPEARYAQELVLIGTQLEPDALHDALAGCLLAPGEERPLVDPFPAWDTHGVDDTCDHETVGSHAHAAVS
ncbi:GTP-binding protein [Streptomyces sp. NPDC091972]|uniref:GTP-binding protein n=1 Tax=Streptomyces sp. NPDC091972 TaxID=3366007 RepID=UPI0037FF8C81